jgi:hypothetical protein
MKNINVISAIIYTGISIIAAALFILTTFLTPHTDIERFGGAAWVFILCMIILMPVVIPLVKKRQK